MGSALARSVSVLELADIDSAGDEGSFWQLLTQANLVGPFYQNLAMQTEHRSVQLR